MITYMCLLRPASQINGDNFGELCFNNEREIQPRVAPSATYHGSLGLVIGVHNW